MTEPVFLRQFGQRALGFPCCLEWSVQVTLLPEFQVARQHQLRPPLSGMRFDEPPETELLIAAQGPVVDRLQLLDQRGFLQQRADLAASFDALDAPHLLRQIHFPGRRMIGGKVGQHALLQFLALADIQGQIVLAIEQIHPCSFRQIVDRGRVKTSRQTRTRRQHPDRLGQ